eukprot:365441-Chlamydomonas_euryale.AAC.13
MGPSHLPGWPGTRRPSTRAAIAADSADLPVPAPASTHSARLPRSLKLSREDADGCSDRRPAACRPAPRPPDSAMAAAAPTGLRGATAAVALAADVPDEDESYDLREARVPGRESRPRIHASSGSNVHTVRSLRLVSCSMSTYTARRVWGGGVVCGVC